MLDPTGVPCFLQIHSEIDQIHQNLRLSLRLHVSSHDPVTQPGLSVFRNKSGDDRVEWSFVRFETIRVFFIECEKSPPILQDKPGPIRHQ